MKSGLVFVAVAGMLLTSASFAQHQTMGGSHFSHGSNGGHPSHNFFGGFGGHTPPPPPPMKTIPRGPQGHFLPTPHNTPPQGRTADFSTETWHGGHWEHHHHHGRFGWFWVVGDDWFYYDEPVYPYPDAYTPPGEEPGFWYWCDAYQEYYPYVTDCPSGWVQMAPQD